MFRLMDGFHAVKPSGGLLLMIFLVSRRHVNVLSSIVLIPRSAFSLPGRLGSSWALSRSGLDIQRETCSGLQGRRAADFVSNNAWCSWGILSPHLGCFIRHTAGCGVYMYSGRNDLKMRRGHC